MDLVNVVGSSGFRWSDVPLDNPFQYWIMLNSQMGYTRGWPYPDNRYQPFAEMTRQQFVELAINGLEIAASWSGQTFTDVNSNNPYHMYVEAAYHTMNGGRRMIDGCTQTPLQFCPGDSLKRAQAAKIVVNGMGWPLLNPPVPHFSDIGSPGQEYPYMYVETAYAHGLIGGYSDGTFRPYNNVTRGQANKIVYNAWASRPHGPSEGPSAEPPGCTECGGDSTLCDACDDTSDCGVCKPPKENLPCTGWECSGS